jgi:N-acetylglutamate synthase-like GNAT family acetyltransferase
VAISTIDTQLLSALELLHYSRRFRDSLFVFAYRDPSHCSELLTDLRIIRAAGIRQVVFCRPDEHLEAQFEVWNKSGETFSVISTTLAELRDGSAIPILTAELEKGVAPVVVLDPHPASLGAWIELEGLIVQCAATLNASKVFFPMAVKGLEIDEKFRSYPTMELLRQAISEKSTFNLPVEQVVALVNAQERFEIDLVIVEARRGSVYEEVFTHGGSGTLLTQEYPNIMRQAVESDVRDIMALMMPYISEGSLKAMSEDEVLSSIRSFSVYSVNSQLVAAAALIPYDDCVELAKLCTLPRYQARGRARALVRELIVHAKEQGKRAVFALTVQSYVGDFFERLGFVPVPREDLPASWKATYDFSRPSKAFLYDLTIPRPDESGVSEASECRT